ncbi:MAG: sigma-70 family RNA polymerase sigma factor [Duncaniella sp.]|nr:sigma-70 family RNA polymerase sigma factor [Duncaniella sp.]
MNSTDFEKYFRKLYLPLGMYALRLVDDADVAEDMVQDAFLKAWQYIDGGGVIDNFVPFMYRSVRNVCLTHLRSCKEVLDESFIPEAGDEEIDTSLRDARLWRAIDELPDRCREIFLMSKRDGLTNDEIADELDLSVKTVKNQITKAFSRLRAVLSPGYKPFFLPFL